MNKMTASAQYNPLYDVPPTSPYGSTNNGAQESTGYITPPLSSAIPRRKGGSKWVKFGLPVTLVVIIAAVVAGIVASKNTDSDASSSASSTGDSNRANGGMGGSGGSGGFSRSGGSDGRLATATDTKYMIPVYPSTTNAAFASPTFLASSTSWPQDPFSPSSPSLTSVRPDRPRLIAPKYKWDALPSLISSDVYMHAWNASIFDKAADAYKKPVLSYFIDGSSGILDIARETKMRVKMFAYAYRMTEDTKWVDRAWAEIQNAATFGPETDKWYTTHFLDTAEFSAAFGIAYDWLYDLWTPDQRTLIRNTLITYGLSPGLAVFSGTTSYGWWHESRITGNWNCVCNGGLTLGALAILGDDDTGVASQLLANTVDSATHGCVNAVAEDGSWAETAHYWYFGTTGHAEMSSALQTATGSSFGLFSTNSNFAKTGQYHMAVTGSTSLFEYGDHGPNKFSTTANSMFLYAKEFNKPEYALFQREQIDASTDPWSMFWYDPSISGSFFVGLPLDTFFDNALDQWASMRSSWTDSKALYVAIKAGKNQGHQTHNDLDAGDFVLDALGTRWAGELGSGDYNSIEYFNSDEQDAKRWTYYRKMTEGQNTILINKKNQDVKAAPTVKHDSTGDKQGKSTVSDVGEASTAYWVTDMTSAYFDATSVKRGIRLLNGRRQVLLQDEISSPSSIQWRMHTNATITLSASQPTTATLTLDSQTLTAALVNPPSGAVFSVLQPERFASDPEPPQADSPNPGVSVLVVDLPQGGSNLQLQVLFTPQWPGLKDSDYVANPPSVPLDSWSLTSHN